MSDALSSAAPTAPAGLPNLGNTCYMNSVLQALASCDAYRAFLDARLAGACPGVTTPYTRALRDVVAALRDFHPAGGVIPVFRSAAARAATAAAGYVGALYDALRASRAGLARFRDGAGFEQEDAHEFLLATGDIVESETDSAGAAGAAGATAAGVPAANAAAMMMGLAVCLPRHAGRAARYCSRCESAVADGGGSSGSGGGDDDPGAGLVQRWDRARCPVRTVVASAVACLRCGHGSAVRRRVYRDLSLSVEGALNDVVQRRRQTNPRLPFINLATIDDLTLEDCLNNFTKIERVSDYECDHCCGNGDDDAGDGGGGGGGAPASAVDDDDFIAKLRGQMERRAARVAFGRPDARKRLLLAQLGPVICIHLQRRHFNIRLGCMGELRVPVAFPLRLDASQWIAEARQSLFDAGSGRNEFRRPRPATPRQQQAAFEAMCLAAVRDGLDDSGASAVDVGHGLGLYFPFEPRRMAPHREPGAAYRLAAVVLHHGSDINGHYTAYRRANDGSGAWASVSDSMATPVDVSEVLGNECRRKAYMLFYERCADSELASMQDALPPPLSLPI